jgi:hypothetical protein
MALMPLNLEVAVVTACRSAPGLPSVMMDDGQHFPSGHELDPHRVVAPANGVAQGRETGVVLDDVASALRWSAQIGWLNEVASQVTGEPLSVLRGSRNEQEARVVALNVSPRIQPGAERSKLVVGEFVVRIPVLIQVRIAYGKRVRQLGNVVSLDDEGHYRAALGYGL